MMNLRGRIRACVAFYRKSFSRKITFSYLVIFILVAASGALFTSQSLKKEKIDDLKESLTTQARLISQTIMPALNQGRDRSHLHDQTREFGKGTEARITLINPDGLVLGDSEQTWQGLVKMDNHAGRPEIQTAFQGETGMSIRYSTTMKMDMLYVAIPLQDESHIIGVLRLALTLGAVEKTILSIQRPVFLAMGFGILAVIFLGVLLGGSIARRVNKLKASAKKYMAGNLKEKVTSDTDDELGLLADTMNQMAEALSDRIGEIEEEKNKLTAILNNMAEAVIAVDCDRKILIVNPAAKSIFGLQEKAVFGKGLIEVVRNKKVDDLLTQAIINQTLITSEIHLTHPTARELRVNVIGTSCQKGVVCAFLVATDISEMRKLENVRKEFVANVSHELKTPLTSIKGSIEILQGNAGSDQDKRRSFLKMMEEDGFRLSRLIDDLLELSKIESGEMPLKLEPLNLADEVDVALTSLRHQLKEKNTTFENKISEGGKILVSADKSGLSQILINLIDNAVKFNQPGGKIILNAERKKGMIHVSVTDTGYGIPEEAIPRIFERFYRVDKARSRELGGTGLGLSIVKHIVEAHEGIVACKSTLGEGSIFSFTLPLSSHLNP